MTGATVSGCDLSPELLDVAANRTGDSGLSLRFDRGTVENLPCDNANFDDVGWMFCVMLRPGPSASSRS